MEENIRRNRSIHVVYLRTSAIMRLERSRDSSILWERYVGALRRSVTWDCAYTEHMRKTFITQDSPRPLVRLWSADFVAS